MRKFLLLTGVACLFFTLSSTAQDAADAHIKQLVTKHAAKLGLTKTDLENYRVSHAYFDENTGITMAYLQQTYKGVDVYNAITSIAFKNDALSTFQSSWIAGADEKTKKANSKPSVKPAAALRNALNNLNISALRPALTALSQTADGRQFEFDNLGIALNDIGVKLMWVPESENSDRLTLSWQVSLITLKGNDSWLVNVNAGDGRVFRKDNLTAKELFNANKITKSNKTAYAYEVESFDDETAQIAEPNEVKDIQAVQSAKFNVIPYPALDKDHAAPTLVTNPWTVNGVKNAYTKKWNTDSKDYDSLHGNNVWAYSDANKNNQPDFGPKSTTALPNLTFNFTPDFNSSPLEDILTQSFGLTSLFYWNNFMHDMSYDYGFTEAAGNMQTANLGRGGKQNDLVIAEDYDTGDTLNANLAPAVDGKRVREQLFFAYPSPLKVLKMNAPASFAGFKITRESNVSNNNKLSQTGAKTGNIVIYKDSDDPDSSTGCVSAGNAAQLSGKIAYIDRGSCAFTEKFKNAQLAGAIAIIVGNVAEDDPRYPDGKGNTIVIMSAQPLVNSITIPGVFVGYDTAQKIKNFIAASTTVNATLQPSPNIDAALDNTIATHEYTHGISTRLVGGAANVSCLNNGEQMGEGWSDYFALMMTTNWATAVKADSSKARPIGNYLFGLDSTYTGIRIYPYSHSFTIDPWTYDSLQVDTSIKEYNAVLHPEVIYYTGEIWCSAMWDLTWDLIKTEGINKTFLKPAVAGGNTTAMNLAIQSMKLVKCSPGMMDMRDAVLKADTTLYSASHSAAIWKAFARRGMGYSAVQGSNNKIKDGHGAYDLPPGVFLTQNGGNEIAEQATRNVKPTITVGPNPTKDYLKVRVPANKEKLTVQLMSNSGSVIGTYIMTNETLDINVSSVARGVYNLLITGSETSAKFKVVVQ